MALTTDPEVMRSGLATDIYAVHGWLTPPDIILTPPKISVPSCSPPPKKIFNPLPPNIPLKNLSTSQKFLNSKNMFLVVFISLENKKSQFA